MAADWTRSQWVDKDEPRRERSSESSALRPEARAHNQAHLCCDLPVACAFASSRLKGNGQPGLSCAEACWASPQRSSPPSASLKAPSSVVPVENSGLHPLLLCHPHALVCFFFVFFSERPSSAVARWTAQPNKLMSQNVSTLRTYCTARRTWLSLLIRTSLIQLWCEVWKLIWVSSLGNGVEKIWLKKKKKKSTHLQQLFFFREEGKKTCFLTDAAFWNQRMGF